MDFIDDIKSIVISNIPKILTSVFILIITFCVANYISNLIPDINIIYHQARHIIYYSIVIFGIVNVLVSFGIQLTTIYAILGGLMLTLALSFQSLITNMVATFYVLLNNLFNLKDTIQVGSITGTVIDFGLINTRLSTGTQIVTIPNSFFLSNPIYTAR